MPSVGQATKNMGDLTTVCLTEVGEPTMDLVDLLAVDLTVCLPAMGLPAIALSAMGRTAINLMDLPPWISLGQVTTMYPFTVNLVNGEV